MSSNSSSSNNSFTLFGFSDCFNIADFRFSNTTLLITRALLISPLVVLILYLAYQRWKQQGSLTSASHCDIFTYHLAAMELFTVLGTPISLFGSHSEFKVMVKVGDCLLSVPYCGEYCLHCLTCAERYLAVVHPHTYMGLKTARGIRIRNVIIGCVWLACLAWLAMSIVVYPKIPLFFGLSTIAVWLVVVAFCSLSVLFVLIRSRPGERGQSKGRVDKSKQKAFLTMSLILMLLLLRFVGFLIILFVSSSTSTIHPKMCVVAQIAYWTNIPSSVVLPLLYLQRSGKLSFCCHGDGTR